MADRSQNEQSNRQPFTTKINTAFSGTLSPYDAIDRARVYPEKQATRRLVKLLASIAKDRQQESLYGRLTEVVRGTPLSSILKADSSNEGSLVDTLDQVRFTLARLIGDVDALNSDERTELTVLLRDGGRDFDKPPLFFSESDTKFLRDIIEEYNIRSVTQLKQVGTEIQDEGRRLRIFISRDFYRAYKPVREGLQSIDVPSNPEEYARFVEFAKDFRTLAEARTAYQNTREISRYQAKKLRKLKTLRFLHRDENYRGNTENFNKTPTGTPFERADGVADRKKRLAIKDRNKQFVPELRGILTDRKARQQLELEFDRLVESRSNALKRKMKSASNRGKPYYFPLAIVGSGPNGTATKIALQHESPGLSQETLTIERDSKLGGTFRKRLGIFMNSAERPVYPNASDNNPGMAGSLNWLGKDAPLNTADITSDYYTPNEDLGIVTAINNYLSGDALVETDIVSIEPLSEREAIRSRAKYLVVLKDLVDGEEFAIYSDGGEIAAGSGKKKFGFDTSDRETLEILKYSEKVIEFQRRVRAEKDTSDLSDLYSRREVPDLAPVYSPEDFLEEINRQYEAFPLQKIRGKDIVIVGRGDYAYTVLERILGQGPEDGSQSSKQSDELGEITWVVTPGDADEVIEVPSRADLIKASTTPNTLLIVRGNTEPRYEVLTRAGDDIIVFDRQANTTITFSEDNFLDDFSDDFILSIPPSADKKSAKTFANAEEFIACIRYRYAKIGAALERKDGRAGKVKIVVGYADTLRNTADGKVEVLVYSDREKKERPLTVRSASGKDRGVVGDTVVSATGLQEDDTLGKYQGLELYTDYTSGQITTELLLQATQEPGSLFVGSSTFARDLVVEVQEYIPRTSQSPLVNIKITRNGRDVSTENYTVDEFISMLDQASITTVRRRIQKPSMKDLPILRDSKGLPYGRKLDKDGDWIIGGPQAAIPFEPAEIRALPQDSQRAIGELKNAVALWRWIPKAEKIAQDMRRSVRNRFSQDGSNLLLEADEKEQLSLPSKTERVLLSKGVANFDYFQEVPEAVSTIIGKEDALKNYVVGFFDQFDIPREIREQYDQLEITFIATSSGSYRLQFSIPLDDSILSRFENYDPKTLKLILNDLLLSKYRPNQLRPPELVARIPLHGPTGDAYQFPGETNLRSSGLQFSDRIDIYIPKNADYRPGGRSEVRERLPSSDGIKGRLSQLFTRKNRRDLNTRSVDYFGARTESDFDQDIVSARDRGLVNIVAFSVQLKEKGLRLPSQADELFRTLADRFQSDTQARDELTATDLITVIDSLLALTRYIKAQNFNSDIPAIRGVIVELRSSRALARPQTQAEVAVNICLERLNDLEQLVEEPPEPSFSRFFEDSVSDYEDDSFDLDDDFDFDDDDDDFERNAFENTLLEIEELTDTETIDKNFPVSRLTDYATAINKVDVDILERNIVDTVDAVDTLCYALASLEEDTPVSKSQLLPLLSASNRVLEVTNSQSAQGRILTIANIRDFLESWEDDDILSIPNQRDQLSAGYKLLSAKEGVNKYDQDTLENRVLFEIAGDVLNVASPVTRFIDKTEALFNFLKVDPIGNQATFLKLVFRYTSEFSFNIPDASYDGVVNTFLRKLLFTAVDFEDRNVIFDGDGYTRIVQLILQKTANTTSPIRVVSTELAEEIDAVVYKNKSNGISEFGRRSANIPANFDITSFEEIEQNLGVLDGAYDSFIAGLVLSRFQNAYDRIRSRGPNAVAIEATVNALDLLVQKCVNNGLRLPWGQIENTLTELNLDYSKINVDTVSEAKEASALIDKIVFLNRKIQQAKRSPRLI